MYQDAVTYGAAGPILWCAVKCGAECAIACGADTVSPVGDVVGYAYGFSDWGGK